MMTIPLHRSFSDTLRRRHISMTSSVKRNNSRTRAAHLYWVCLPSHALVYRVCRDDGIKGRYLGLFPTAFASTVSWYMLIVFMRVVTIAPLGNDRTGGAEHERASDASSASLNLPGRNQVMDLREDSRVEMVETLFMRNASYFAKDMEERDE